MAIARDVTMIDFYGADATPAFTTMRLTATQTPKATNLGRYVTVHAVAPCNCTATSLHACH